jgi:hypothetical protein
VEVIGSLSGVNTMPAIIFILCRPYSAPPTSGRVPEIGASSFALADFYPTDRWSSGPYVVQGRTTRVCYWQNGEEVVWGATARILLNLLAHLGVHPIHGDRHATCLD